MIKILKKYSFSILLLITCVAICPFLFKETFFKKDVVPTTPDFSVPSYVSSSSSSDVSSVVSSEVSSETSSESSSEVSSETSSETESSEESSIDDTVTSEESSYYEETSSSEDPIYSEDPVVSNDPVVSDVVDTPTSKIDYPALIIGDSRTVGVRDYGYVPNAYYYASVGLSSYGLFYGYEYVNGEPLTLEQALAKYNFKNIYIGLGLNEMGGYIPEIATQYAYNVQRIRELAPNSTIYVQAILHVSPGRNSTDTTFNNARINEYNSYIASNANGADIIYLDANPYFDDENGNMKSDYTSDGIHFYAVGYVEWGNFIASTIQ